MTLKDLRLQHKLSQRDIATKLNIGQSAYSMIENGARGLTVENARILSELYDIDWWLLFENETVNQ